MSRVEDRERLLAEALAHAEEAEQQYKVAYTDEPPRGRWKTPAALGIFVLAGVLALFPPGFMLPDPLPQPTAPEIARGLRTALVIQAAQVEVYRVRHGELPNALEQVPGRLPGLRYLRSNSRVYQVVGDGPDGSVVVFDSARPAVELDPGIRAWLGADIP